MVQGLIQASELVDESMIAQMNEKEWLLERENSILEPISKSNIKTSNEKKKSIKKIITILKEDK